MQVFQAAVGVFRAFRPSTYACCNSNHLDGVLPVLQFFTPSYGPSLSPGIKAHGQLARDQFGQMTCEATELCLAIDPKILPIYLCISHAFQHHIPYSIFTCRSVFDYGKSPIVKAIMPAKSSLSRSLFYLGLPLDAPSCCFCHRDSGVSIVQTSTDIF